jgi:hypothetical protein
MLHSLHRSELSLEGLVIIDLALGNVAEDRARALSLHELAWGFVKCSARAAECFVLSGDSHALMLKGW